MALYIPAGRRRRRLIIVAVVAAAVGLLVGVAAGRATAPTAADGAADAKREAAKVSGLLAALPLHYGQMVDGRGDPAAFQASLDDALRRSRTELDAALAAAPWLDAPVQDDLRRRVDGVGQAAGRRVAAEEFQGLVDDVVLELARRFGQATPAVSAAPAASSTPGTEPPPGPAADALPAVGGR